MGQMTAPNPHAILIIKIPSNNPQRQCHSTSLAKAKEKNSSRFVVFKHFKSTIQLVSESSES